MKIIKLSAYFSKHNLRILKNYIITFKYNSIELYDLKGNLLDNVIFRNRTIINIEIISDNYYNLHCRGIFEKKYLIIALSFSLLIMKINFEVLEFHEVFQYLPITNILLIKNKNLLVINSKFKMAIFDINNL